MKNDLKSNGGAVHFRSPEELLGLNAESVGEDREFPEGVTDVPDEASRRDFIKLMSASAALAGVGLTGCRRPEELIYAFGNQPQDYIHGVPQYFATSMPTRSGAIPLVAKSNDGRPTKVEGNSEHPDSNGGTDVFAQASVLGLYDPDRARRFTKNGSNASREEVLDLLAGIGGKFSNNAGDGLAFLAGQNTSPSQARLVAKIRGKFPKAIWAEYEPVDTDVHRRAATLATGKAVSPRYELAKAKRIVSLDCDFLGVEEDAHRYIRDFAKGRKIAGPDKSKKDKLMNRLYVVEALMSQTGANADHRLRLAPSQMVKLAARMAQAVLTQSGSTNQALLAKLAELGDGYDGHSSWLAECARDLIANKGDSLIVAGERQPIEVHVIAHVINLALGGVGKTVSYLPAADTDAANIGELNDALNVGKVDTLVLLGGNPGYDAPADLNWAGSQAKAKTVVRLGSAEDESFPAKGYQIPEAHYLESWGDARTSDGTYVSVQPLIAPLFDGMTAIEVLARILGEKKTKGHDIVQATFTGLAGSDPLGSKWKKLLHDGYRAGTAARPVNNVSIDSAAVTSVLGKAADSDTRDGLEVVFNRDYSVDDGRYSNNGWLQELPDPITKLTWDNAAMISRKTAVANNLKNRELVTLKAGNRTLQAAVWVQPGQADGVVGLALGYGRKRGGRIANFDEKQVGFNANEIRTTRGMNALGGVKIVGSGKNYLFADAQEHWAVHGRPIVRESNLEQYLSRPDFAKHMDLEAHMHHVPTNEEGRPAPIYKRPYEDPSKKELKSDVHQWGMVIDLNSCVGCSACVIACQSENNIPIVGKDQVSKRREMHWMRIDRYYTGALNLTKKEEKKHLIGTYVDADQDEWKQQWIDEPQVVNQPMLCQHCENAPCESVCPVNATAHDTEGLNLMAYNRCVGTRYCSNNCAWKVRRFNWFDYNKRPTEKLYQNLNLGDILSFNFFAKRKEDEIDLLAMAKNPDVTVRMRGVMEKCTFCVQRIEQAKIAQKVEARDSNDVRVKEGAVKSACQQSCPAEAIHFGNLLDPESKVSKIKKDQRNYEVLGFLDNKARVTYMAKVRNPNPSMPDYIKTPYGLGEYEDKYNGSPFGHSAGEEGGTH
jgi:Fe-S-cluster-containing dehydrogenase component